MGSTLNAVILAAIGILCCLGTQGNKASGAVLPFVFAAEDGIGSINPFSGVSNPTGFFQINPTSSNPGYLNNISGGENDGSAGRVTIFPSSSTELVGVAIHVCDDAGDWHSLSSLGDPALMDIVDDLNANPFDYNQGLVAYPFNAVPSQFSAQVLALSAGESANKGQPFDILLLHTTTVPFPAQVWSMYFTDEIGNADGITAFKITDIGAIPEPRALSWAITLICTSFFLLFRPKHRRFRI